MIGAEFEFRSTLGAQSRSTGSTTLASGDDADAGGRMRIVDGFAKIRQAYRDGLSTRRIARDLGVGRDTVREALPHAEPPLYTLVQPRAAPAFGPFRSVVDAKGRERTLHRNRCRIETEGIRSLRGPDSRIVANFGGRECDEGG